VKNCTQAVLEASGVSVCLTIPKARSPKILGILSCRSLVLTNKRKGGTKPNIQEDAHQEDARHGDSEVPRHIVEDILLNADDLLRRVRIVAYGDEIIYLQTQSKAATLRLRVCSWT
jgi:hypothetical protein